MSRLALVVEDDKGLRTVYRHVLADMDYEILEAADGETALSLLRDHSPDILFLDIWLPHINGTELLDFIYEAPHLQDLQIVIVSSNKAFEQYALDESRVKFAQKPIRPAQIREFASSPDA